MGIVSDETIALRVKEFQESCCPFGYLDIKAAISFLGEYGYDADTLMEQVEEYTEQTDVKFNDVDICGVAYNYIMQNVREKIKNIIGFDIQNDAYFEVSSNYMCTSFDVGEEDKDKLAAAIKKAGQDKLKELVEDEEIKQFFEEIEFNPEGEESGEA